MRLADGVLLVVDVLEGVGAATERAIQQAVAEGLAITLIISKVSRCWEREGGATALWAVRGQFAQCLR
jgi:translation elongation factor EF-G